MTFPQDASYAYPSQPQVPQTPAVSQPLADNVDAYRPPSTLSSTSHSQRMEHFGVPLGLPTQSNVHSIFSLQLPARVPASPNPTPLPPSRRSAIPTSRFAMYSNPDCCFYTLWFLDTAAPQISIASTKLASLHGTSAGGSTCCNRSSASPWRSSPTSCGPWWRRCGPHPMSASCSRTPLPWCRAWCSSAGLAAGCTCLAPQPTRSASATTTISTLLWSWTAFTMIWWPPVSSNCSEL